MSIKVSIIIPTYNCGQYISEAIDSVIAQTYTNWECIIIDDGSTDNTHAIINNYCSKDDRIKYFYQENQCPSVARNTGIGLTSGEYILPVDADDRIAPTYIEKAVAWFIQHPETTLVYGLVEYFDGKTGPCNFPPYNYEDLIWNNSIICSAMFRRSDFNKTSGYNPKMKIGYEDWEFWLTLLNKDSIVHRIDEVMYFYRQKKDSRNTNASQSSREAYSMMQLLHPEIYSSYAQNIIPIYGELLWLRTKCAQNESKINSILNSHAYRIGKIFTQPLACFRNHFKH